MDCALLCLLNDTIGSQCKPCYAYTIPAMCYALSCLVFAVLLAVAALKCHQILVALEYFRTRQEQNNGVAVAHLSAIRTRLDNHVEAGHVYLARNEAEKQE